ncbi:MAG: protein kinase [bacterium]|nr:protein kinase [bacterium]
MSCATVLIAIAGRRQRFDLRVGELATVGRSSTCQVQVRDQSVSREHCVAVLAGDRIRLNNLASTHGIVFEGERVDQCELAPGERCRLGNAVFLFEALDGVRAKPKGGEPLADAATAAATVDAFVTKPGPRAVEPREQPVDDVEAAIAATAAELDGERPVATSGVPGVDIEGFRIFEVLGSGGSATVYRAEQVRLGREVALKVLRLEGSGDDAQERIAAFQREARAAAGIEDPRLVQVFDVAEDGGAHYLAMEFVKGGSLAGRIKRQGPLEWRDALAILTDMTHALAAAHARGLVHRDVKPANILLTEKGEARLTDLGLAGSALSQGGDEVGVGTLAFMAPEQIRRQAVDARTDIYALGCTIYAALVGRAPFTGDQKAIARGHLEQPPESFQRLGIKLPWHLEQLVIDSMMAKSPADRPADTAELLERVGKLVLPGSEPVAAAQRARARRDVEVVRVRNPGPAHKRLLARILSELIVVSIIAAMVIASLLALKIGWGFDIYALFGR